MTYDAIRCHYRSNPTQTQSLWRGATVNHSNPAVRWRQVIPKSLRGRGFGLQAELSLPAWVMMKAVIELSCHSGGLSHKSLITCLLHLRKNPGLSQRGRKGMPREKIQLLCQCGFSRCTHFSSTVLQNQKKIKILSKIWQAAKPYLCRIIFSFFSALVQIGIIISWRSYPHGPSSRDFALLPSHPLPTLSSTEPSCQYWDTKCCSDCQREATARLSRFTQSHYTACISTN